MILNIRLASGGNALKSPFYNEIKNYDLEANSVIKLPIQKLGLFLKKKIVEEVI